MTLASRRERGIRTELITFIGGTVLGGLSIAGALLVVSGFFSGLPADVRQTIALLGVGLIGALDALSPGRPQFPQRRRQIDRENLIRDRFGTFSFGWQLGTASRTYMPSATPHAVALVILATSSPSIAAAAGLGFGIGRGLALIEHSTWPLNVDVPPNASLKRNRAVSSIGSTLCLLAALGSLP